MAESWFGTFKRELVYTAVFPTIARAKRAIFDWIETVYNRQRRHSSIGYHTPLEYEQLYHPIDRQAA